MSRVDVRVSFGNVGGAPKTGRMLEIDGGDSAVRNGITWAIAAAHRADGAGVHIQVQV